MDALWIAAALLVGVVGGWPVTAGTLALAKSRPIRAVDAAESSVAAPQTESPSAEAPTAEPTAQVRPSAEAHAAESPAPAAPSPDPAGPDTRVEAHRVEVLRGGLLIGMLERAAVVVAIFSGQPVAIAYVVAIKGLGRYPELKSTPAASERFIIGTLASLLFSASVAVLTKVLLL